MKQSCLKEAQRTIIIPSYPPLVKGGRGDFLIKIPFNDLTRQYKSIEGKLNRVLKDVLKSGWFILGKNVETFEKDFANYVGKKYGIGVASGTDALFLSLLACDIKAGDEVITVPNTAIPTIAAISATGAKPVLVDVNQFYTLDTAKIEEKISSKTKAIIPVHLYGQPCQMDPILKIAKRHNILVIEDCAQAHGAEYKGKKLPAGDIGCFSFYPTKNLGAYGDGGIIVTDNERLSRKLKLLRNYGETKRFTHIIKGYNSRLDEIQAAILRIKLKHLDRWNRKRRRIAKLYNELLSDLVATPQEDKNSKHVYHLYVVRTEKRNELKDFLFSRGIGTNIHYPIPVHLQKGYSDLRYKKGSLPKCEKYSKEILSLPIFPELKEKEIEYICESVREFFK